MSDRFVIIIGAGAAGLSCASHLSGTGKRICIVEAPLRRGGEQRVKG